MIEFKGSSYIYGSALFQGQKCGREGGKGVRVKNCVYRPTPFGRVGGVKGGGCVLVFVGVW